MHDGVHLAGMDWWIADVRAHFTEEAPQLLSMFEVYAEEAAFGRRYLGSDLNGLHPGARLLEVGAGSLLLSCQLVREGFQVTGLEPLGSGFSHFEQMRQIVQERATKQGCLPQVLDIAAEDFTERNCYDYAFSVNVMEHVNDVARVVSNVGRSLKVGKIYRFTCANYLFPYEPHFNIPTLFSKRLTERVLGRKIFGSTNLPDPHGTWKSLNWISVVQVRRIARRLPWLSLSFDRRLLIDTIERIAVDANFAGRRSPSMRSFLLFMLRMRVHHLLRFMPAVVQPIMDCRLQKTVDSELR